MAEGTTRPTKQTFAKTARLVDDFFKVDEYRGTYERYDNAMSAEQRLLVFERGDSAAVLLFDPAHHEVILTEQFRLPTVQSGLGRGWLLEPAAGMIREGETPKVTAIRELTEETGYNVTDLTPIATFFVSPGGTSERIFLFFAEVRRIDQKYAGGGASREGEHIKIVHMPVAEFFAKLHNQELEDAKLIIAAHWLKQRLAALPTMDAAVVAPIEFYVKSSGRTEKTKRIIGYRAGNILNVNDIDVWVNPLSTDMLLDRFGERTVSAVIRKQAAQTYADSDRIKVDVIGEELRQAMDGANFVRPGTVIDTSSGALAQTNKVRRIFHVATSRGEIGEVVNIGLETIDQCVDNTLARIEASRRYESVLFPLLGTGDDGIPTNRVAPRLFERAIKFFQENPKAILKTIHFLAYSVGDRDVLEKVAESLQDKLEPISRLAVE